jgi:phosphatidate phosphatase PAH1
MSSSKSFLKKWGAFFDYRKPSKNSTMDILVVRSRSGELRSSSFHVDFKWKTTKPATKQVDLIVNGNVVDLKMKLSKKGRAYFEVPDVGESNSMNWSTDCHQSEDDILLMSANEDFPQGDTKIQDIAKSEKTK